ncbi:MAG: hypothetical protein K0R33_1977, partial [Mycobacterium sp.]|nr:hypothetical protein [Mycobacterium sp.]
GNWNLVPANLQKAWTDEVAAFQKVLQLPQTLITYNTKTIQNFVNSLGTGGSTLAVQSVASSATALPTAQSDITNALLVVLGIPFNNLNTTRATGTWSRPTCRRPGPMRLPPSKRFSSCRRR